ncbi:Hydroxymethylglutaryl-CoA lyase [Pseudomonas paraeruginosa]|nr:Hydroxymethylglutaryl-CoA lyase [Pseudomonas aeruginosa]
MSPDYRSIQRILVANRGEIACRVMRSARALGIGSVAVHSEIDRHARHVAEADIAVDLGGAKPADSYLRGDRIIAAALASGAQAIHPGYGFLSENAGFARACEEAGLLFLGPPAAAIDAMGSKSAAKALMEDAGVPLVPGYHGEAQDLETFRREAGRIGYPVLLKAAAGGGGKGMKVVEREAELAEALSSAQREAKAAFGDARMLVEKYLLKPRHVEIQVFADRHGHCLYLNERDCSIQRRHQKVVEEAPAPGLGAELRRAMGEAAVRAAQAIGYVGAGTVEFLLDERGQFFFMEMNTRLQVEHPVTEAITGLDLVAWQIRVARGEALPLTQEQVPLNGHAIEVRRSTQPGGRLPPPPPPWRYTANGAAPPPRRPTGGREGDEGLAVLRPDAGQADRLGRNPRGSPPAPAGDAGGNLGRRRAQQPGVPPPHPRPSGIRRRRTGHRFHRPPRSRPAAGARAVAGAFLADRRRSLVAERSRLPPRRRPAFAVEPQRRLAQRPGAGVGPGAALPRRTPLRPPAPRQPQPVPPRWRRPGQPGGWRHPSLDGLAPRFPAVPRMGWRTADHRSRRPDRRGRGRPCPPGRFERADERQYRAGPGRARPDGRSRRRPGGAGGDENGTQHPRAPRRGGEGAVLQRGRTGRGRHAAGGAGREPGLTAKTRNSMNLPKKVRLVEVGPRDGLQNEKQPIEVADKIRLVDDLSAAGLDYIEVGSFVSPKWVPQMAGSAEVFAGIRQRPGVTYAALAPNLKGFEAALESGVKEVAVFAAASEAFSQRNINCSIKDSLERFVPVLEAAHQHQVRVRGYISCVLGCPYDGDVDPRQVAWVARELQQMGCYEVSLGDTIGIGTAGATRRLIEAVAGEVPRERLAGHFHDTYGQALANIYASLLEGVAVFDSSVAGLGGCPYAKGATGNVASEDVLYLLNGLGIETGVDMHALVDAGQRICAVLGRSNGSRAAKALLAKA